MVARLWLTRKIARFPQTALPPITTAQKIAATPPILCARNSAEPVPDPLTGRPAAAAESIAVALAYGYRA
jgi:hypothetical protein